MLANGLLGLAVAGCSALLLYPPSRGGFYPQCPIYEFLHIQCPGCGATHALAALLHGRLAEAMRLNPFFVVLLPFALAAAAECYRRAMRMGEFRWPQMPPAAMYAMLASAAVFTVARNLVG